MTEYTSFSSLAPQDEAAFVVFERATNENQQKSYMAAMIGGAVTLLLALVIYFGFAPPPKKHAAEGPAPQTQHAPAEAAPAAK